MIDFSHVVDSPAVILTVALAALCLARVLFRLAFRVLMVFAVIGAGAVLTGAAQLPAGLNLHALTTDLQAAMHQAASTVNGVIHTGTLAN